MSSVNTKSKFDVKTGASSSGTIQSEKQNLDFTQNWALIYRSEFLLVVFCIFTVFVFYRLGQRRGLNAAQKVNQLHLDKFCDEIRVSLSNLSQSQNNLKAQLEKNKLIPDGHTLVALKEGQTLHKLESGYVLSVTRQFEHRRVAEFVLGRELASHEVVHHIFPLAIDDNSPENLCVMDREQHDYFHTFLDREYRVKGKRPRISEQKAILKKQYYGILLEEALASKDLKYPPIQVHSES